MWRLILITGLILWLAGAAQLVLDLLAWGDNGGFEFAALGDVWFELAPALLNGWQVVLERYLWPPLWDPVMLNILLWPASLIGLFAGTILMGLGYAKTKKPSSA